MGQFFHLLSEGNPIAALVAVVVVITLIALFHSLRIIRHENSPADSWPGLTFWRGILELIVCITVLITLFMPTSLTQSLSRLKASELSRADEPQIVLDSDTIKVQNAVTTENYHILVTVPGSVLSDGVLLPSQRLPNENRIWTDNSWSENF